MAGGFTRKYRTINVPIGGIMVITNFSSIDLLNVGTVAAQFKGQDLGDGLPPSQFVPLPPFIPYTLEFNPTAFNEITIDNSGGDGVIGVVVKY